MCWKMPSELTPTACCTGGSCEMNTTVTVVNLIHDPKAIAMAKIVSNG